MSVDPQIRPAISGDLPAVLELYRQDDFNGGSVDSETALEIFERQYTVPGARLYVAETAGRIAGSYCLFCLDNIAANGRPSAIIESVVVAKTERGTGLGQAMMECAFEQAKQYGCYKICLFTSSSADYVHEFYQKLGFAKHGISYQLPTNRPE